MVVGKVLIFTPTGEFAHFDERGELWTGSLPHQILPDTASFQGYKNYMVKHFPDIDFTDIEMKSIEINVL